MNIKIAALKSRLKHSVEFEKEITSFIASIEDKLNNKIQIADLSDYDCDLKLVFVQTGGSEGLFLNHLKEMQEPYYLLTNGSNNSLAASMEILTYLNQHGKRGEILHGSSEYIAKRINELANIRQTVLRLRNTRLGVIGKPSDWLISSIPDYAAVKETLGVTLVDIPLTEVEKRLNAINLSAASNRDYPKFDNKELSKAIAVKQALQQIVSDYNLDGFTIRCFDLLTSIKSTGCLALAELNRDGVTATCEGDVAAMISMHIIRLLTGLSSFQANPSEMNVESNSMIFAHCTIPLDMVDNYSFDTHFESGIGVAIKGSVTLKRATVFRLSSDLKRYYVTCGSIVRNLNRNNLCRTQLEIKLSDPITEILKTPCGNHHIITYGDFAESLDLLMTELLNN